ncbi:MAG: response regulator transcription factor [Kofleriaceae bacterium]
MTRIVLAEPNFILRQALQKLLLELGAEVVAVSNAEEAAQTLATSSGLLLIDGSIAIEEHAFERFQHLQDLQVILVTWGRQGLASWAKRIGALGVIDLTGEESAVRAALQRVSNGESPGWPTVEASPELTRRELYVLLGIAAGRSNREMAQELGLSIKTIDSHRAAVLRRIGARNNADATRFAIRSGLVPLH